MEKKLTSVIKRINVKPGDTIVIQHQGAVSEEHAAEVKRFMETYYPDNTVLVLGNGASIRILSKVKPG